MITLIMIMTLAGSKMGGVSINTEQYQTMLECETVKSVFLGDMHISRADIQSARYGYIFRKATCTLNNPWPKASFPSGEM